MPRGNRDPVQEDILDVPASSPQPRRGRSAVAPPTSAMISAAALRGANSASRAKDKGKGKATNPSLSKASGSSFPGVGKFIFYI